VTNKSPEYLSKFPLGKLPAFEDNKGFKLFEGAPIARYGKTWLVTFHSVNQRCKPVSSFAPESGLLGKDRSEAALVDQWAHFGETEVATFSYEIMALVAGYLGPYSREVRAVDPTRV
jgi:elongation factor 1-gamma